MENLHRWQPNEPIKASTLNETVDALTKGRPILVGSGLSMSAGVGSGTTLKVRPPMQESPVRIFIGTITNTGPNGEPDFTDYRYWVKLEGNQNTTSKDSDPLNLKSHTTGDIRGFIVCVYNLSEITAGYGQHRMKTNNTVRTAIAQVNFDESVNGTMDVFRYIFLGSPAPQSMFPVQIMKDGGDQGSAAGLCSYTYTVMDVYGTVIGVKMSPLKQRPLGAIAQGNSWGIGFYDSSNNFHLWDVGEYLMTTSCVGS